MDPNAFNRLAAASAVSVAIFFPFSTPFLPNSLLFSSNFPSRVAFVISSMTSPDTLAACLALVLACVATFDTPCLTSLAP